MAGAAGGTPRPLLRRRRPIRPANKKALDRSALAFFHAHIGDHFMTPVVNASIHPHIHHARWQIFLPVSISQTTDYYNQDLDKISTYKYEFASANPAGLTISIWLRAAGAVSVISALLPPHRL
ncbi:MAG: hypothetical protein U1E43_00900 [Rhodospirillales bacterium]